MDNVFCPKCNSILEWVFNGDKLQYYCKGCESTYEITAKDGDKVIMEIAEEFKLDFNPDLIGTDFIRVFFKTRVPTRCSCGNDEYYVISKDLTYHAYVCSKCHNVYKTLKINNK
jgi:DNA-directed RNA polymerase subunit M/transcription elongation factor TFIIS